jgi:hypothetical protein
MSTYSLGTFNFVSMSRPPRRGAQQAVNEVRPGMDGHAIFYTGIHGDEFEVQTFANVVSSDTPEGVAHAYEAAKNTLATLTYNGTQESNYYQILDVQIQDASAVLAAIGGLSGTTVGRIIATWRLVQTAVAVPPPSP